MLLSTARCFQSVCNSVTPWCVILFSTNRSPLVHPPVHIPPAPHQSRTPPPPTRRDFFVKCGLYLPVTTDTSWDVVTGLKSNVIPGFWRWQHKLCLRFTYFALRLLTLQMGLSSFIHWQLSYCSARFYNSHLLVASLWCEQSSAHPAQPFAKWRKNWQKTWRSGRLQ
jgi:hypothetical protein